MAQNVVMKGRTITVMSSTNNRIDGTQGRADEPTVKSQFKVGKSRIGDRKEIGV